MNIRNLKVNQLFMMDGDFYIVRCVGDEHVVVERMMNVGPNRYKATGETHEIAFDEVEAA